MKTFLVALILVSAKMALGQIGKIQNLQEIKTPALNGAMTPFLMIDNGRVWMSWQEPVPGSNSDNGQVWRVRVSKFAKGKWGVSQTVVTSKRLLANWADFPSLQRGAQGVLYVNWLEKPEGAKGHGYFVNISRSSDQGKNWKSLGRLHRDKNPSAEHGFVTMVPDKGGVQVFWLDGGKETGDAGSMQLRVASVSQKIKNERVVDTMTCSCCGTSSVSTQQGPLVFYRDRTDKEIRDISAASIDGKSWSIKDISKDGWEIRGCPVNGPNADSDGKNIAMAWYSGGGKRPGVKVTFSTDGGLSYSTGVEVDDFVKGSLGRVQVVLVNPNQAVVFWMNAEADGKANIYARRVHADGRRGRPVILVESKATRGSGFPQIQKMGDEIFLAWTVGGESEYQSQGIKLVRFSVDEIPGIKSKDVLIAASKKSGQSKKAPQLTAKDLDGNEARLFQMKGQNILLNFWASWCDACIEEFGMINELEKKYASKGLKIIMVNVDESSDWSKAEELIRRAQLSPTVWRSSASQTSSQFGYSALPYTVLLDAELMQKSTFTGSLLPKKSVLEKRISHLLEN